MEKFTEYEIKKHINGWRTLSWDFFPTENTSYIERWSILYFFTSDPLHLKNSIFSINMNEKVKGIGHWDLKISKNPKTLNPFHANHMMKQM
jgi:hypothetical protein